MAQRSFYRSSLAHAEVIHLKKQAQIWQAAPHSGRRVPREGVVGTAFDVRDSARISVCDSQQRPASTQLLSNDPLDSINLRQVFEPS